MLYVTTRNKTETYTSYKTLVDSFAPDGGSFLPFKMPVYTEDQILTLKDISFNQIVADILNAFFTSYCSLLIKTFSSISILLFCFFWF